MVNGIRTSDPCGFNKGQSSKFRVDSRVRQTPEEGWRTYWPKHWGNNKDEDSLKTLNDKKTIFWKIDSRFNHKNAVNIPKIMINLHKKAKEN